MLRSLLLLLPLNFTTENIPGRTRQASGRLGLHRECWVCFHSSSMLNHKLIIRSPEPPSASAASCLPRCIFPHTASAASLPTRDSRNNSHCRQNISWRVSKTTQTTSSANIKPTSRSSHFQSVLRKNDHDEQRVRQYAHRDNSQQRALQYGYYHFEWHAEHTTVDEWPCGQHYSDRPCTSRPQHLQRCVLHGTIWHSTSSFAFPRTDSTDSTSNWRVRAVANFDYAVTVSDAAAPVGTTANAVRGND